MRSPGGNTAGDGRYGPAGAGIEDEAQASIAFGAADGIFCERPIGV
jgi:hypothetical protein